MIVANQNHSTAAAPAQFADSPFTRVLRQPLILGLFLPVQSGGWSASLLPRTTDWIFDYNAALSQRAEALGFDLVFGLAQWTSKQRRELKEGDASQVLSELERLHTLTQQAQVVEAMQTIQKSLNYLKERRAMLIEQPGRIDAIDVQDAARLDRERVAVDANRFEHVGARCLG